MLTYCTNIHPAESWQETFAVLNSTVLNVKRLLTANSLFPANSPFPIGLRLSARAARELLENHIPEFRNWLESHNCFVPTINGFPYGDFHAPPIKQNVFLPDWSSPRRLAYTKNLFDILVKVARPDVCSSLSVSTLPASFKEFPQSPDAIAGHLAEMDNYLELLASQTGLDLHMGLEPEPLGLFENTDETISFLTRFLDSRPNPAQSARRIGVTYDTCHFALEYDNASDSLQRFARAGIRISKIHASNALAIHPSTPGAISALLQFEEPTYLHQTLIRHPDGNIQRFRDLPLALDFANTILHQNPADSSLLGQEWRVHFHIPLGANPTPPLLNTTDHLLDTVRWFSGIPAAECPLWEIETYTWNVLPQSLQLPIEAQIVNEWAWLSAQISSANNSSRTLVP